MVPPIPNGGIAFVTKSPSRAENNNFVHRFNSYDMEQEDGMESVSNNHHHRLLDISHPELKTMTYTGPTCSLTEAWTMNTLKRQAAASNGDNYSTTTKTSSPSPECKRKCPTRTQSLARVFSQTRQLLPPAVQKYKTKAGSRNLTRSYTQRPTINPEEQQQQQHRPLEISHPLLQRTTFTSGLTDLDTARARFNNGSSHVDGSSIDSSSNHFYRN